MHLRVSRVAQPLLHTQGTRARRLPPSPAGARVRTGARGGGAARESLSLASLAKLGFVATITCAHVAYVRMEPVAPPFDAAAERPPASLLSSLDATYSDLPPARPAPDGPTLQETVLAVEAQAEPADDVAMDGDEGMTGNGAEVRAASGWIERGYCSAEEKKRRRAQSGQLRTVSQSKKEARARTYTRVIT